MTDTWGVHLLDKDGGIIHSGPGKVEFNSEFPAAIKDSIPDGVEFIIRTYPQFEFPGDTVYQVKVVKNNNYYAIRQFTDIERIANRGIRAQFGAMICESHLLQPKKPVICPCGIHREDCDYHK